MLRPKQLRRTHVDGVPAWRSNDLMLHFYMHIAQIYLESYWRLNDDDATASSSSPLDPYLIQSVLLQHAGNNGSSSSSSSTTASAAATTKHIILRPQHMRSLREQIELFSSG